MRKECANCRHEALDVIDEPCLSCKDYSAWELKEQEDDMENENKNTATEIDTEAELKEQVAKLQAKLDEANEYIDELNQKLQTARTELAVMRGMVDGLKFAIRCNGVSGGEV